MSLPHAILGILNYMPMTGYDLKKFFDDSVGFFWSAQMSQIYRELKTLEKNGFVVSKETTNSKGPNKKTYKVTKQGITHLKEWLSDVPDKVDEDNHNAFLLRVMLSSNLGTEDLYFQIKQRLKKYRNDLKELKIVEGKLEYYLKLIGKEEQLVYWEITLSRGIHDVTSHIEWAEESLKKLKSLIHQVKEKEK